MDNIVYQQKISLLIPTLNAGELWADVLESISFQTGRIDRKFIVDSGSTDNTVELAIKHGFTVKIIPKSEFNHGLTRQLLVDLVPDTDICVFLTQDALLATPESIANIVKVFDNKKISIAYGRQLPNKNASVLEAHARLFNYPDKSEIRSLDDKEQLGFKVFFCSNSFSAYRRIDLINVGGFPSDSIMGEDAIVAAKLLLNGHSLAYVAEATAYHSHDYTATELYKRYFDTRVFHEQNKWLIDKFGKPTGEGLKFAKSELTYALKNDLWSFFKSIALLFAKWLGYKTGKFYKKIPVYTLSKISMHKYYWQ